jgi:hypothetical protein
MMTIEEYNMVRLKSSIKEKTGLPGIGKSPVFIRTTEQVIT